MGFEEVLLWSVRVLVYINLDISGVDHAPFVVGHASLVLYIVYVLFLL